MPSLTELIPAGITRTKTRFPYAPSQLREMTDEELRSFSQQHGGFVQQLRKHLHNVDSEVRWTCVQLLGRLDTKDAARDIALLEKDENSLVRSAVAHALGTLKDERTRRTLLRLLGNSADSAAIEAESALRKFPADNAISVKALVKEHSRWPHP